MQSIHLFFSRYWEEGADDQIPVKRAMLVGVVSETGDPKWIGATTSSGLQPPSPILGPPCPNASQFRDAATPGTVMYLSRFSS